MCSRFIFVEIESDLSYEDAIFTFLFFNEYYIVFIFFYITSILFSSIL